MKISLFCFANPDATLRVLDLGTMFPPGSNSSRIRAYGISLAKEFEYDCIQLCRIANLAYCDYHETAEVYIEESDAVKRIGIMLGQQIHMHLRRNEDSANIWGETFDRLMSNVENH